MRRNQAILALALLIAILPIRTIFSQIANDATPYFEGFEPGNDDIADKINDYVSEALSTSIPNQKVDLNTATEEIIHNLPVINASEAELIYHFLLRHRPLFSIYQLQSIQALSPDKLRKLIPYLSIDLTEKKGSLLKSLREESHCILTTRWSRILQKSKGYQLNNSLNSAYLGSPDKFLIKLKNSADSRYSLSFMAEKDSGEPIFDSHTHGFDFISANLYLENITKYINILVLGDYTLQLGQGLLIDNGFSIGKNEEFGTMAKKSTLLKPYQSLREDEMLRGIAAKLHLNRNLRLILFYSSNHIDGNRIEVLSKDSTSTETKVSSIETSGLHRNHSELNDKNAVRLDHTGTSLEYGISGFKAGINGVFVKQNPPLTNQNRVDRAFISDDNEQLFGSFHHQWIFHHFTFCGELAFDKKGNHAVIENAIVGLGKKMEALFSYRNFHQGFYSSLSNTLSTSSLSWNEKSLYMAINLSLNARFKIHGGADFTRFPWIRYQDDLITGKSEYALKFQYTIRKKWDVYIQFRSTINELNALDGSAEKENKLISQTIQQIRLAFESKLNSDWSWRSRIEFHHVSLSHSTQNGMMISQDLLFKSLESRFSGNIRMAFFDIQDYSARIYSFENDVQSQFSLTAYNGRGIRVYINLRYRLNRHILLESKCSNSFYPDESQNGSSYDQILSPYKTEIKFQIQFQF